MLYRPQVATIRKVVEYLHEIGLEVYGPTIDKYGCEYTSLMDYNIDEILARRYFIDNGILHEDGS